MLRFSVVAFLDEVALRRRIVAGLLCALHVGLFSAAESEATPIRLTLPWRRVSLYGPFQAPARKKRLG